MTKANEQAFEAALVAFIEQCVAEGMTVEDARKEALRLLALENQDRNASVVARRRSIKPVS